MVSNVAKGSATERLAQSILHREGYKTHRPHRARFQPLDIFGADIIAIRPDARVRLVQVKQASASIGEVITPFEAAGWPPECCLEGWFWHGVSPAGITRTEWARSQFFLVRKRDDGWALDKATKVWVDTEPPVLPEITHFTRGGKWKKPTEVTT